MRWLPHDFDGAVGQLVQFVYELLDALGILERTLKRAKGRLRAESRRVYDREANRGEWWWYGPGAPWPKKAPFEGRGTGGRTYRTCRGCGGFKILGLGVGRPGATGWVFSVGRELSRGFDARSWFSAPFTGLPAERCRPAVDGGYAVAHNRCPPEPRYDV
jgi:hypothetical protein